MSAIDPMPFETVPERVNGVRRRPFRRVRAGVPNGVRATRLFRERPSDLSIYYTHFLGCPARNTLPYFGG